MLDLDDCICMWVTVWLYNSSFIFRPQTFPLKHVLVIYDTTSHISTSDRHDVYSRRRHLACIGIFGFMYDWANNCSCMYSGEMSSAHTGMVCSKVCRTLFTSQYGVTSIVNRDSSAEKLLWAVKDLHRQNRCMAEYRIRLSHRLLGILVNNVSSRTTTWKEQMHWSEIFSTGAERQ